MVRYPKSTTLDAVNQYLPRAIFYLPPPEEFYEEGLTKIPLNGLHHGTNLWDSPLEVLSFELQQDPQTRIICLGMSCDDFGQGLDPLCS